MASTLRSFASLNARARPTIGDTKTSAANVDHMGWLKCNGRLLDKSDYVQLFNMIGYSFDPTLSGSLFRLPDPEGRVLGVVGQATVPDVSSNTWILGDISGEETHLLTLPEVPAHNHNYGVTPGANTTADGFTDASGYHDHGGVTGSAGYSRDQISRGSDGTGDFVSQSDNYHTHDISGDGLHRHRIASNGGDQRHNNIQPTIWIGNLFIYGGRPWVATPYARALQGSSPAPGSNNYPPQGPPLNIY